jgi:hypothetical protein
MSEDTKKEESKAEVKVDTPKTYAKKVSPKKAETKSAPKKAAKKEVAKAAPTKPARRYSFEQWASRRGVKAHHRGGLRAFIKNPDKPRTLEDWDACFKGY